MEEQELSLLDKAEFRIALAEDDSQLEKCINIYLCPIILKLGSPFSEVRKKVLQIIQAIIPRINAAKLIKLPIFQLLDQAKTPSVSEKTDSSSIRLYSLLFVSRFFDRLDLSDLRKILPKVCDQISTYNPGVSARLFNILCKALHKLTSSGIKFDQETDVWKKDLSNRDKSFICHWTSKLLLLDSEAHATTLTRPGLSNKEIAFLTIDAGVKYDSSQELSAVKVSLLTWLVLYFSPNQVCVPFLIASCDSISSIRDLGEDLLKKTEYDINDEELIQTLVTFFEGSTSSGVPPLSPVYQEKITKVLLKSSKVALQDSAITIALAGLSSDYKKFKKTAILFIKWVITNASETGGINATFAEKIASKVKANLINGGWPKSFSSEGLHTRNIEERLLQYEILGTILSVQKHLFSADFEYILFLLQSLRGDVPEVRPSIQETLSGLSPYMNELNVSALQKLKDIAKDVLSEDDRDAATESSKYILLKFVNSAFPFDDACARYLCILGTMISSRNDISEEAENGLNPYKFKLQQPYKYKNRKANQVEDTVSFPSFSSLVHIIAEESKNCTNNSPQFLTLPRALKFCFQTLVMNCVSVKRSVISFDDHWEQSLDKAIEVDENVNKSIGLWIHKSESSTPNQSEDTHALVIYQLILIECITRFANELSLLDLNSLLTLLTKTLSLSPQSILSGHTAKLKDLVKIAKLADIEDNILVKVSNVVGILSSHPSLQESRLLDLVKLSTKCDIVCSTYIISRSSLVRREGTFDFDLLNATSKAIHDMLLKEDSFFLALECLTQLSICGTFNQLASNLKWDLNIINMCFDYILPRAKAGDEKSISALPYLNLVQSPSGPIIDYHTSFNLIFSTYELNRVELNFTAGESLSILACGWNSNIVKQKIDIQDVSVFGSFEMNNFDEIMTAILKASLDTKPRLRKASCTWLLCMVKYCSHVQGFLKYASQIHLAFMRFLPDRDELVQECASAGLGLIYELGDIDLKDTLVHNLIKSFAGSNESETLTSFSVDSETELFDADVMKTNEGSVRTYSDVLNLATDIGNPGLVYKFMSLAKSSALWSSRKGMAFGLGNVLSKHSLDELLVNDPELTKKLIPKLYRYRFDPYSSVAKAMNDIWNILVPNTAEVVKEHYGLILRELLTQMSSREWRTREGSTAALNGLVLTYSIELYSGELKNILYMCFRVVDDIKESVRKEGLKLAKSLANILVGLVKSSTKISDNKKEELLTSLVPFLLGTNGISNSAKEVREFSLDTLIKLCDTNNPSMLHFIPSLLENFVVLMSSLEPEAVNYLILNAEKYNIKQNDIDSQRLRSVGSSPMMNAVEKLLETADGTSIDSIVSALQRAIKRSVGLPSKVAGSRILVSLVTKYQDNVSSHAEKLLRICVDNLSDRNQAISSSYAVASGYLCKIMTSESIISYSEKLETLYFSEDERSREISSIACESVSKYMGDRFESFLLAFLPLAFIGKYDTNDVVRSHFDREWSESTAGIGSARLYEDEIIEISSRYIMSNSFELRKIIGRALIEFCKAVDSYRPLSVQASRKLFDVLINACQGKSWSGKELLVESLVTIASVTTELLRDDDDLFQRIKKVVMTEAKRRNRNYQKLAVISLGKFIKIYHERDAADAYLSIMDAIIARLSGIIDSDDEMDVDAMLPQESVNLEEERLCFLKNVYDSFSPDFGLEYVSSLVRLNRQVLETDFAYSWRTKTRVNEWLSGLIKSIMVENVILEPAVSTDLFDLWSLLRTTCSNKNNIENVKIQFVRTSALFYKFFNQMDKTRADIILETTKSLKEQEFSDVTKAKISKALQLT